MKKVLLFLFVALFATNINAQVLRLGVKAGIVANYSELKENLSSAGATIETLSNPTGYHFGAFLRCNLPFNLYLQPEALFSSNTNSYYSNYDVMKQRVTQFDVPVLLGLKVVFLRLNAGPMFRFKLTDKVINDTGNFNIGSDLNNRGVGYQVGLGVDLFSKITVDARFQSNFSPASVDFTIKDVATNIASTKLNQNMLLLSLGYMF